MIKREQQGQFSHLNNWIEDIMPSQLPLHHF
jgi:hypothetical protein